MARSNHLGLNKFHTIMWDFYTRVTQEVLTTLYAPNPRKQFFGEINGFIDNHTKVELTAELNEIGHRIEDWQADYNVRTPMRSERSSIDR